MKNKKHKEIETDRDQLIIRIADVISESFYQFTKENKNHFENMKWDRKHDHGVFNYYRFLLPARQAAKNILEYLKAH